MQEQLVESPSSSPMLDDRLKAAVQKRNRELADYFRHWARLEDCANGIRQLVGASSMGIDAVMNTLSRIEDSLDLIHAYLTELGRILRHNGDFDLDSYLCTLFERQIGNRQIRRIEEIPEAFHDNFRQLFAADTQQPIALPRETDAIRADLGAAREALDALIARKENFSAYLPDSKTSDSPELDAVRKELAFLWDEFLLAARAAAYQL